MLSRVYKPLSYVRLFRPRREALNHWLIQRVTAIALVPLSLWLIASIWKIVISGVTFEIVEQWISSPINAVLILLFLGILFWHLKLGLQVVIEDYIHTKWLNTGMLITLKVAVSGLFIASVYSVISICLRI